MFVYNPLRGAEVVFYPKNSAPRVFRLAARSNREGEVWGEAANGRIIVRQTAGGQFKAEVNEKPTERFSLKLAGRKSKRPFQQL